MKNLSSILNTPARLLLVVVIAVLIVAAFSATALTQGTDRRQAKAKSTVTQDKSQERTKDQPQDQAKSHPTAGFWQEVGKVAAAAASDD